MTGARRLGLLGLAGALSYMATKWVIERGARQDEKIATAQDAFYGALRDYRLNNDGAVMPPAEQQILRAAYLDRVAEIKKGWV